MTSKAQDSDSNLLSSKNEAWIRLF